MKYNEYIYLLKGLRSPQVGEVYWRASQDHVEDHIEVVHCLPAPNNKECENEAGDLSFCHSLRKQPAIRCNNMYTIT